MRIALKQAPEADYHVGFLAKVAPWLLAFRHYSSPECLVETMQAMRPLFSRAVAEHEALMAESGAERYMRHTGWLKLYRSDKGLAGTARERALAAELGMPLRVLDVEAARALEPSLAPVFRHAVFWEHAASVSNPLAVTQAYVARFKALGGVAVKGDAMRLHQSAGRWRVDTAEGPIDAEAAVVTLGPWAPDLLDPLGIKLPLAVKRGYHRHFRPRGNAGLARPILDAENGYCIVPMEQGIRITTGAEFAPRDAAPTPVQFDRVLPRASELFPLGDAVEAQPWMGARPCFADFAPGDRPRTGQAGPVARLRPRPFRPHARAGDRAARRGDDDRRDAVLRSGAVPGGAVRVAATHRRSARKRKWPGRARPFPFQQIERGLLLGVARNLADRVHHARSRALAHGRQLLVLEHRPRRIAEASSPRPSAPCGRP